MSYMLLYHGLDYWCCAVLRRRSAKPNKNPELKKTGDESNENGKPFGNCKTGSVAQLTMSLDQWGGCGGWVFSNPNSETCQRVSIAQHGVHCVGRPFAFAYNKRTALFQQYAIFIYLYMFLRVRRFQRFRFYCTRSVVTTVAILERRLLLLLGMCRFRTNEFSRRPRVLPFSLSPVLGTIDLYPFSHIPAAQATSSGGR